MLRNFTPSFYHLREVGSGSQSLHPGCNHELNKANLRESPGNWTRLLKLVPIGGREGAALWNDRKITCLWDDKCPS